MRRSAALLAALLVSACGSSSISTPPPPASPGPLPRAEVTIRASGFEPTVLHIYEGRAVKFINADSQAHSIFSDRHAAHDTCGGILNVRLEPGEERQLASLPIDACFFHDESDPGAAAFQGVLIVH